MTKANRARMRNRRKAQGLTMTTVLIPAIGLGGVAWADCQPDPPAPNSTVTCTGNDPDGFQHPEISGLTVNALLGATVSANGTDSVLYVGDQGTINNAGSVTAGGSSLGGLVLDQAGSITNSGTISAPDLANGILAGASFFLDGTNGSAIGIVKNTGQITVDHDNGSGIASSEAGSVLNSGLITANGSFARGIGDFGTASVTNDSSGSITVNGDNSGGIFGLLDDLIANAGFIHTTNIKSAGMALFQGGTVQNSGTIQSDGTQSSGILVGSAFLFSGEDGSASTAAVTNTGQITGSGDFSDGTISNGITNFVGGSIENSGTIAMSGIGSAGVFNLGTASVTNQSAGLVSNSAEFGLGLASMRGGTTLTNHGTISMTGPKEVGLYGVHGVVMSNDGQITTAQAGSAGIAGYDGGTAFNSGSILISGAPSIGIFLEASFAGDSVAEATNSGDIAATNSGVLLHQDVVTSSALTIQAAAQAGGPTTRLVNSGAITQIGADGAGVASNSFVFSNIPPSPLPGGPGGGTAVSVNDGGSTDIQNSGTITAEGPGISFVTTAAEIQNLQDYDFTVSQGSNVPSGDNVVVNTGTISGGTAPAQTTSARALAAQNPAVAIQGGLGRELVTNKGTLNGNVLLGGGNDSLTLFTGSTNNGDLDGGAGTDDLLLEGTGTATLASAVLNFESLAKQGTGAWTVSHGLTFGGPAAVSQGSLTVQGGFGSTDLNIESGASLTVNGPIHTTGTLTANGALTSTEPVHVDAGVLKGSSTIEAPVVLGGSAVVAPGNSPGTLTINGDFTMGPGNTLQIEIADLTHFDVLKVLGVATLDGTLDVLVDSLFAPSGGIASGQTFDVVVANSIADSLNLIDNLPGYAFTKQVVPSGGSEILRLTVNTVPLPGTLPLMAGALAALGLARRKRAARP